MPVPSQSPAHARDAAATRARILKAVERLLVRQGFAALGVNAVAREAGVDKVLIYRYFGGLDGLLETWGASTDFWPSQAELLGPNPETDPAQLAAGLLKRHLQALRRRPHTLAILAWETIARNPLTEILDRIRETRSAALMTALAPSFQGHALDLEALSALLGAGLQHLLLRSRTVAVYGGIAIASPEGWARLEATLDHLCARMFPTQPAP